MGSIAGDSTFLQAFRYVALVGVVIGVAGCSQKFCTEVSSPGVPGWAMLVTAPGCLIGGIEAGLAEEKGRRPSFDLSGGTGELSPEAERILAEESAAREARLEIDRKARIADLKQRSDQGDVEATIELAELTGNLTPLQAMAEDGQPSAAYALYEKLSRDEDASTDAWRWLCKVANEGSGKAQSEVGYWHRASVWQYSGDGRLESLPRIGIEPDNRVAYMWYTLADDSGAEKALAERAYVTSEMRDNEIAQAERMVRDWKPGQCPSPKNRMSPPGET